MKDNKYADYRNALESDATDFVNECWDTLVEQVQDGGIRDNGYSFIDDTCNLHEHVDGMYIDFEDAFHILENCGDEETDSGLWEGQKPKDAIVTMAFFTYRNELMDAVKKEFVEKLDELAEEEQANLDELNESLTKLREELEELPQINVEDWSEDQQTTRNEAEDRIEALEKEISDKEDYIINIENTSKKFS